MRFRPYRSAAAWSSRSISSTLKVFDQTYGKPHTTIAWGHSLGGIITAGLIQDYPNLFKAALPMCSELSGGVATWNTELDAEFAFQQLIDPKIQVINITNLGNADTAATAAQRTPQGRARLALVAALDNTAASLTPLSPQPAANDYAAQEHNQYLWDTDMIFPFVLGPVPSLMPAPVATRPGTPVSTSSPTWPSRPA